MYVMPLLLLSGLRSAMVGLKNIRTFLRGYCLIFLVRLGSGYVSLRLLLTLTADVSLTYFAYVDGT